MTLGLKLPQSLLPKPVLPKSIFSVIEARLARLSEPARAVAEVAATIGRSFTFPVLVTASALAEDKLVDALDELWRRRIIREREADAYDFSHDRIRDVAYASPSRTRRRHLHKRVAAAIVQTHPGAVDEMSGELGYHYEQAGERLTAIDHYVRAATIAAGQYAHRETEQYLDRVLALALPEEVSIRFDALLRRDRMIEQAGTIPMWQENVRQLCALAEQDQPDPLRAARWRALNAERASRLLLRERNNKLAVVHARQAVNYAALINDGALQALCHHSLGLRLWYIADFAGAIHHLEKAIALARQVEDSEILANALEIRAQTYMFNGGAVSDIEPLLQESLSHYEKVGSLYGRCQILNKLGYLPFAQGTGIYEESHAYYREAIQLAQQLGALDSEVGPQRNLAIVLTCMGNYAAAEERLALAQACIHALGRQGEDPVMLNYTGFLRLSQGRLADALAAQQRALAGLTEQSHAQWRVKALTALGWIYLRLEQPEQAGEYLETAIAASRQINEKRQLAYALICRGILRTGRGDLAAARPDFEEARTILRAFKMFNRALEAEAGLAYIAFLEGDATSAHQGALAIANHLDEHPVDFSEDVCQLLVSCLRILNALDPAASERLRRVARHHLDTRTATLDAATQTLFWQIPAHQELRQASSVIPELAHAA